MLFVNIYLLFYQLVFSPLYLSYKERSKIVKNTELKNIQVMKALNKETANKTVRPERIIQFGEGNFLRAFVDWIIYNMDQKTDFNSSVVVVQPIDKGMVDMLNAQDCLYHVNLQGLEQR